MGILKLLVLIEEGYRANRLEADRSEFEFARRNKARKSWAAWQHQRLEEKITKAKAKLWRPPPLKR